MSDPADQYDEAYFMRGIETGKSLYTAYTWKPDLTIPMVQAMIHFCGIKPVDDVMDFGCSRGYVVKAFRQLGYQAFGVDCSKWAVENCDPDVKKYVGLNDWRWTDFDWIVAKDVLEHVPDLGDVIDRLLGRCNKGLFVVVPLAAEFNGPYAIPEYEKDATHIHRLTLPEWAAMFMRPGWAVTAEYKLRWIKQNYAQHPTGNGFLTMRRAS